MPPLYLCLSNIFLTFFFSFKSFITVRKLHILFKIVIISVTAAIPAPQGGMQSNYMQQTRPQSAHTPTQVKLFNFIIFALCYIDEFSWIHSRFIFPG